MQDRSEETFSRDGIVVLDLCNVSYMDTLHANGRENLFWSQVRNWKPPLTSMGGQMTFDVANRRVAFSPLNTAMVGNAIDPDRSSERKMAWFHAKTWKPMGLMRDEKGAIMRCSKMNEVHFRGKDCVYFGQRYGYGRYKEPEKIFPPSQDKTPPTAIAGLKAAVGAPAPRWAGGAIVAEVVLTWSPATDNEGVQRYAVWRDGELIGNGLGVNPALDPVMSPEDQAEYEKQAGKFMPNTFKARYLAPGKTYKFVIEPIDFAQNRGPRATISVEVPAVSDEQRLALAPDRGDHYPDSGSSPDYRPTQRLCRSTARSCPRPSRQPIRRQLYIPAPPHPAA